jgi:hypothetical protein
MNKEVKEFGAAIMENARKLMQQNGELAPVAFALDSERHYTIHALDFSEDSHKMAEAEVTLPMMARDTKAVAVAMVSEAWVRNPEPPHDITDEVLMFGIRERGDKVVSYKAVVKRDAEGNVESVGKFVHAVGATSSVFLDHVFDEERLAATLARLDKFEEQFSELMERIAPPATA